MDYIIDDSIMIFLDSNIKAYDKNKLLIDFIENPKLFYTEISNYPKIYFDFNSYINFYYENIVHKKYIINDIFFYKIKILFRYEYLFFSKRVDRFDIISNHNIGYINSIIIFESESEFIKHSTNLNVSGCSKLMVDDEGYLYFSELEKEHTVFYSMKKK
jgi:hypothetical protein